jgi:hypothetical protein
LEIRTVNPGPIFIISSQLLKARSYFGPVSEVGLEIKHGLSHALLVQIKHQHFGSCDRDKPWPFPCIDSGSDAA